MGRAGGALSLPSQVRGSQRRQHLNSLGKSRSWPGDMGGQERGLQREDGAHAQK